MSNDEPIGGGDGLPEPKPNAQRRYEKLPGLTRRQTYHVITAIPVVQVGLCFLLFFGAGADLYKISYSYLSNFMGFSLLTGLYYWYASRFMGSCGGAIAAVWTIITLNGLNILYSAFEFDYYFIYGAVVTGIGLLIAAILYNR